MRFADMTKQPAVAEKEIVNPSQPTSPTEPPYLKKNEYTKAETPSPLQNKGVALYGKAYAEGKGWIVCASCFEAIERRSKGQRYLSYREADIAARNKLLDNEMVVSGLMSPMEFFICEDLAGLKDAAYELRAIFNRGIEYKRTKYATQTAAQKAKCDDYMKSIVDKLSKIGLPPWPEELKDGFHSTLCRPEYMTDEQYKAKVTQFDTLLVDWKSDKVAK